MVFFVTCSHIEQNPAIQNEILTTQNYFVVFVFIDIFIFDDHRQSVSDICQIISLYVHYEK